MPTHPFHILDVFAEEKYAGNQLAVFLDAGDLPSETMQRLARETNFSETTFVLSSEPRDGGYDVRIFTPSAELPFAGHPTLGTAWVIQRELLGGRGDRVVLNLGVGQVPVTFTRDEPGEPVLWMRQKPPRFGRQVPHAAAAEAIGLTPADLDERFPVEEVSTGLPGLMVPVRGLAALQRSSPDHAACRRLLAGLEADMVMLFCQEAREAGNHLAARCYAELCGIAEDPATGSACGDLAGYLVRHRLRGVDAIDLRVEQGYEIGRPSLLRLRAREAEGGEIEIDVGGRVIPTMRGELM